MTIKEALSQLGFSEQEIELYLTSLKSGPCTAEELAEKTSLTKLSLQTALQHMLEQGLFSVLSVQGVDQYSAEPPSRLLSYLEKKKTDVEQAFSFLQKEQGVLEGQMSDEKPTVRFFEGKEGLKAMLREFNEMKSKYAMLMYPVDQVHKTFSAEEREQQRQAVVKNNLQCESILFMKKNDLIERKNISKSFVNIQDHPFSIDLEIYDNKVAIASLGDNKHGVIIESKNIADSFREIYKLVLNGIDPEKAKRDDE